MVVAAECAKAIISRPPPIARSPERSVSSLWSRVLYILACCCCSYPYFVEVKWSRFSVSFFSLPPFLLFVPSLFSKVPT